MITNAYRQGLPETNPEAISQIRSACQFLHDWRKFEPVIAGGSLWAWAAGQVARDVDVFVRDSWRSRRWVSKLNTAASHEYMGCNRVYTGYGSWCGGTMSVYRHMTEMSCGTKLDIVLTPWTGIEAVDHFDYEHCMVGFGPVGFTTKGVDSYASGNLKVCYPDHARSEAVIRGKIYEDIWGRPTAAIRMEEIIFLLRSTYNKVADAA